MAPGDLNLKKSWNPKLMKNRKKVWEREQEALEERKKIKLRQEEIKKDREKQEFRNLMLKNGSENKHVLTNRIDWMYESHGTTPKQNPESDKDKDNSHNDDDYLLGKKRLDDLILDTHNIQPENKLKNTVSNNNIDKLHTILNSSSKHSLQKEKLLSQREILKINSEDPMAKIKMIQLQKRKKSAQTKR